MTLNEVYQAAASGKKVYYRYSGTDDAEQNRRYVKIQHNRFGTDVLVWNATGADVAITNITSVPERWFAEDPKQYDFAEALELMKQGKWMRPVIGGLKFKIEGKNWMKWVIGTSFPDNAHEIPVSFIQSKWVEEQS